MDGKTAGIIVLIILVALGAWFLMSRDQNPSNLPVAPGSGTSTPTAAPAPAATSTSGTATSSASGSVDVSL